MERSRGGEERSGACASARLGAQNSTGPPPIKAHTYIHTYIHTYRVQATWGWPSTHQGIYIHTYIHTGGYRVQATWGWSSTHHGTRCKAPRCCHGGSTDPRSGRKTAQGGVGFDPREPQSHSHQPCHCHCQRKSQEWGRSVCCSSSRRSASSHLLSGELLMSPQQSN
mgnify:CR=1 FL=1